MNCDRFQQNLFEYLDDALSPDEKAAAQLHLQACGACRRAFENEQFVAQTLSSRLSEAVETVTLDAQTQRSMANAVREQIEHTRETKKRLLLPLWARLVIPAALACLVLVPAIWLGRGVVSHRDSVAQSLSSSGSAGLEVPVHVAYSAPRYTFRQQGAMVVDAFTTDTRVADGTLLVKTQNPILYDH
jgi:anti-sigma factor RsiW